MLLIRSMDGYRYSSCTRIPNVSLIPQRISEASLLPGRLPSSLEHAKQ